MSISTPWINTYGSLMKLSQDPNTGMLTGTYSSTTGGTGTYDVIGWASLSGAVAAAGQTMAVSILWRSNDGGKSDPSHEVSGMAGQLQIVQSAESLSLIHLFVETDPSVPAPAVGVYPDKLIFTPYTNKKPAVKRAKTSIDEHLPPINRGITGLWIGRAFGGIVQIKIQLPDSRKAPIQGSVTFPDGSICPLVGFTDVFASKPKFNWQGVTFCTYRDFPAPVGRVCISAAGYLDFSSDRLTLSEISAQSTSPGNSWYQVSEEQFQCIRQVKAPTKSRSKKVSTIGK